MEYNLALMAYDNFVGFFSEYFFYLLNFFIFFWRYLKDRGCLLEDLPNFDLQ